MRIDTFLQRLKSVTRTNGGYTARCPAHDDGTASLSVSEGEDRRVLVKCFAGCSTEQVVAALNLDLKDLFPKREKKEIVASYDYRDESGQLLFQVVRYANKGFKQRRPDGTGGWIWNLNNVRRVLYHLSELLAADSSRPVFVVEGEKDADRLIAAGAVATCNPGGAGKWSDDYADALKDRHVVVVADNDDAGRQHARHVANDLTRVAKSIALLDSLPGVPLKGDVSDYLAADHTLADLIKLATEHEPYVLGAAIDSNAQAAIVTPCTLDDAHEIVRRWFGLSYDLAAFDAMLATMAAERLDGDPVWLLLITGPGGAKTETLSSAAGAGAIITSTIASEGALLSGSSKRDKAKDATGGLLCKIGKRGVLVIKDVTTILSMNREARAAVLAALREIYDGRWERNVGSDGGKSLLWFGRIVVMGAVTTAWDTAHSVVASMGDRFVLVRIDSTRGREEAGTHALDNTGHETAMRAELVEIVGRVMAGVNPRPEALTKDERARLLRAANLVTLCRTSVEYDYQGKVIDAHAPEMPTRFAKQLMQIVRGARAIGASNDRSMDLAIRCARDSMPPLRLAILEAVEGLGRARTADVRRSLAKPWSTVDRQLQSLHMLNVLDCEEEREGADDEGRGGKTIWVYSLATGIDPNVLRRLSPEMSSYGVSGFKERARKEKRDTEPSAKSGESRLREELPF